MSARASSDAPSVDAAYRRFLSYYYLWYAGYDCVFAYAIYTLFLSLRGLSVVQIGYLLSWWSLTSVVLDIPTGALADRWSRRSMLLAAPAVKSLCFLTWCAAGSNVCLFALGFLLWSVGSSLASGAEQALLYDALVHFGRPEQYGRVYGRATSYNHLAGAAAGLAGGLLAGAGLEWAILLSVLPLLGTSLCALRLMEAPRTRAAREVRCLGHARRAVAEITGNKTLMGLALYLLGLSIVGELEEFDQLYYRLVQLPVSAFGVAFCAMASLSALSCHQAYRLTDCPRALWALPLAAAMLLLAVWRYPSITAVGLLILVYPVTAAVRVLAESRIQHAMDSDSRATVTSAVSAIIGAVCVGMPLLLGLISARWSLPVMYLAGAIQLTALSVGVVCIRRRL